MAPPIAKHVRFVSSRNNDAREALSIRRPSPPSAGALPRASLVSAFSTDSSDISDTSSERSALSCDSSKSSFDTVKSPAVILEPAAQAAPKLRQRRLSVPVLELEAGVKPGRTAIEEALAMPPTSRMTSEYIDKHVPGKFVDVEGPRAARPNIELFLRQAQKLAPFVDTAVARTKRARMFAVVGGVMTGIAVGAGLFVLLGPGAFALGVLTGLIMMGFIRSFARFNPESKYLKESRTAFQANLGATLRAAMNDPAIADMLDKDPRWTGAVADLNGQYRGNGIHKSLLVSYHYIRDSYTMWSAGEVSESRFERGYSDY